MATPTWSEVWTQFKNTIWICEQLDVFGNSATNNWVGMEDTLVQSLEGEFTPRVLQTLRSNRANLAAILTPQNLQNLFRPFILELGKVIGAPERDLPTLMRRIHDYMVANTEDINARNITRGSISAAGGNTGNTTILRLYTGKDGSDHRLEASHMEVKTVECVADQNQVNLHSELYQVRGVERELDELNRIGSGLDAQLIGASATQSSQILQNPSFSQFTGTAGDGNTITGVTGWTATSAITNFEINESFTYRGVFGETTDRSLRIIANDTISQTLKNTTRARFDPNTPYWMQAAVYRRDAATGTLTMHFGGVSRAITIGSQTDNQWAVYGIVSTPDQNCWYETGFAEDSQDVKFVMGSLATGTVHVDDVLIVPFQPVDGGWWLAVPNGGGANGSAHVAPLVGDTWTFTDSLAGSDAIIQKWLWRAGLGSLLSDNGGTETIADPS